MRGLFGAVRRVAKDAAIQEVKRFQTDVASEEHTIINIGEGIQFAFHSRARERNWKFDEKRQVGVFAYGSVFRTTGSSPMVSSEDLIAAYVAKEDVAELELDGSHIIAFLDLRKSKLIIQNDIFGTLPLVYFHSANTFAFAPQAKAIFSYIGCAPAVEEEAIPDFLLAGYPFGDRTMFKGISFLEAGKRLVLDLRTFQLLKQRHWNLVYDPDPSYRGKHVHARLHDALIASHRLLLSDQPKDVDLCLSGGMDSRGILAVLQELGRLPDRALTWGYSDTIPYSDAAIAKAIARDYRVPFAFYAYDTQTFVDHARDWVIASELTNDNMGWYAEGTHVLRELYGLNREVLLLGDEIFGWGGYVGNKGDAIHAVLPYYLPGFLTRIFPADVLKNMQSLYRSHIDNIIEEAPNKDFMSIKDYIYVNIRLHRFVMAQAYFKELATPARRPLMTRVMTDVIRRIPIDQRINKHGYLSTLRRYYPRISQYPPATVTSLPDWRYDLVARQPQRDFFLEYLDVSKIEHGPLGMFIDANQFSQIRDLFFANAPQPIPRTLGRKQFVLSTLRRRLEASGLRGAQLAYAIKSQFVQKPPGFSLFDFLLRVMLFNLFYDNLSRFSSA